LHRSLPNQEIVMNTLESTTSASSTPATLRQIGAELQDNAREAAPAVRRSLEVAGEATRDAAGSVLENLRCAAKEAAGVLRRDASHSKDIAEHYIGSNPWRSAAIIGAAGLLIGALIRRR
jgi:ElaB/YqjD/DUF883 family membrane-anchored ribosome-binding protein